MLFWGLGALLMANGGGTHASAETSDWELVNPADVGFSPGLEDSFTKHLAAGRLANVHGVVALRRGRIVFERYMAGTDAAWGRQLGQVSFQADTLHDLRSVTKSIVGLLYGIALAGGHVPPLDQPLFAQFPEYPDLASDPTRAAIKIVHALTMTLGLAWNEALPYTDHANSEIAMEQAPDRYSYILSRPVLATPGQGWIYSGGDVALLARLIEKGTGQDIASFAKAALFEPLGITNMEWARGKDGVYSAASGCRLTPRDLARIGQVVMAKGKWNGRQVVPADWLEASFQPQAIVDDIRHYGYFWYVAEWARTGHAGTYGLPWVAAMGNGGQRLFVFPTLDFVLVVTAGNYDTEDQWRPPIVLLREVFLPNLVA
jgi:CubicO group peptidase (beta-lactamase class C family)